MSVESNFDLQLDQIPLKKQLIFHFYPGLVILLFYIAFARYVIDLGYPGLTALLIAELLILAPIGLAHLARKGIALNGKLSFKNVIAYKNKLSFWQYFKWSFLGIIGCSLVYIPLFPVGLYIKETFFFWLPEWYFDPGFGTKDMDLVGKKFFSQAYLSTESLVRW